MNTQPQDNDILLQHPSNIAISEATIARTNKKWTKDFEPLNKDHLTFQHHIGPDGKVQPVWNELLEPCSDDKVRRAQKTSEPNPIAGYRLASEADCATYFSTEITNSVLSKFIKFPTVYFKMEKRANEGGVAIDVNFYVIDQMPLVVIENKNNTINPEIWLNGNFEASTNDLRLSQELRGYAYEYGVTGLGCFSGSYFLWLIFQAKNREDIKSSNCHVLAWLFAHRDTFAPPALVPVYPLRDALYRFIVQGIRQFQCRNYPLPALDGIQAIERQYFSGLPMWVVGSQITTKHPAGFYRDTDGRGRLCWKYPSGDWLMVDGELVADSWAFDDYAVHGDGEHIVDPWIFHR